MRVGLDVKYHNETMFIDTKHIYSCYNIRTNDKQYNTLIKVIDNSYIPTYYIISEKSKFILFSEFDIKKINNYTILKEITFDLLFINKINPLKISDSDIVNIFNFYDFLMEMNQHKVSLFKLSLMLKEYLLSFEQLKKTTIIRDMEEILISYIKTNYKTVLFNNFNIPEDVKTLRLLTENTTTDDILKGAYDVDKHITRFG